MSRNFALAPSYMNVTTCQPSFEAISRETERFWVFVDSEGAKQPKAGEISLSQKEAKKNASIYICPATAHMYMYVHYCIQFEWTPSDFRPVTSVSRLYTTLTLAPLSCQYVIIMAIEQYRSRKTRNS